MIYYYGKKRKESNLVFSSVLHLDTVMIPCDGGQGVGNNGTVEHQGVAIVLLSLDKIQILGQISNWMQCACWVKLITAEVGFK